MLKLINMWDDFEGFGGVHPDDDLPEDIQPGRHGIRIKALVLLLVFLIPTIILILRITTGDVVLFLKEAIEPHLPQLDAIIHF